MPDPVNVASLPRKVNPAVNYNNYDPASVSYAADFTTEQTFVINLTLQQQQQVFGVPRTLFIDNGDNPNGVTVSVQGTQFTFDVPAYANGHFPLNAQLNDTISFYSLGGSTSLVNITIFNWVLPATVWYTVDPLTPGFDVQAVTPTATAITNRNTTLAAAVAANVFPSVSNARNTRFTNLTEEMLYYHVNATATGSFAAGDMVLQPGQELIMPYRTALRISFYSVSGGNVQAEEWLV